MKTVITSFVGWLLILSALAFYLYGIGDAIPLSWKGGIGEGDYPEVINTTINSIQALLLTNLGIVLGISVTKPILLSLNRYCLIKQRKMPVQQRLLIL